MTDVEVIRAMLERAGIGFEERASESGDRGIGVDRRGDRLLTVERNNHGYAGFFAEFVFTPEGSLKALGAWEQYDGSLEARNARAV